MRGIHSRPIGSSLAGQAVARLKNSLIILSEIFVFRVSSAAMTIYRFGTCELNTRTFEFCRDGRPIPLEPQVFSVLRYLIENQGRGVSKDELISAVWDGRIVSDATVSSRISAARLAVGDTGKTQSVIRTIPRRGFRFVAELAEPGDTGASLDANTEDDKVSSVSTWTEAASRTDRQPVQFCASRDGTKIAFATTGAGYPLVRTGHWLTHIELDMDSPVWGPFLGELGTHFQVTRYDQRGAGLSDWSVTDFGLDRLVEDLEAVVDAAELERFALYSLGAPISVAYAVRHPERVSHLILHGGFVQGRVLRRTAGEREQGEAWLTLMRHGWGKSGSPFVKALSSIYLPGGTTQQIDWLVQLQQRSTTLENAVLFRATIDQFDFTDLLEKVAVPTLVVHSRDDDVQPLDEGRKLAAGIRGSRFLMLDGASHALVRSEPAWHTFFHNLVEFVGK